MLAEAYTREQLHNAYVARRMRVMEIVQWMGLATTTELYLLLDHYQIPRRLKRRDSRRGARGSISDKELRELGLSALAFRRAYSSWRGGDTKPRTAAERLCRVLEHVPARELPEHIATFGVTELSRNIFGTPRPQNVRLAEHYLEVLEELQHEPTPTVGGLPRVRYQEEPTLPPRIGIGDVANSVLARAAVVVGVGVGIAAWVAA